MVTVLALVFAPLVASPAAFADDVDAVSVTAPATSSLTGDLRVGSTVAVQTGPWTPESATLAYAWWQSSAAYVAPVDGVDQNPGATVIDGAASESLTIGPELNGRYVWAVVTGSADGLTPASIVVGGATPVAAGVLTGVPAVSIAGSGLLGATLTATLSAAVPAGVTATYRWQRNGVAISGATAATYTVAIEDVSTSITVVVEFAAPGFTTQTATSGALAVTAQPVTDAPTPTLSGTVRVDSVVTAQPGAWPADTTFTYRWRFIDSKGVVTYSKSTAQSYTPTASTLGKKLSVEVTGTTPGHLPTIRRNASATIAPGVFQTAPAPVVSGAKQVGSTLTAAAGTWAPAATLTYQWKRSGAAISGATKSTYQLTTSDAGKTMTVTVTAKRTSYTTATRTSVPTTTVLKPFAGVTTPKIVGAARGGVTLSVSMPTWSPTPTLSYQWKRGGVAIAGATASTFRLTSRDVGSTITVTVTGERSGYTTRAVTSAATAKVVPANTITRDGLYEVGKHIAPGTYVATGGNNCWFERRSDANVGVEAGALGWQYFYSAGYGGQKVVTIKSTDKYFYTEGCGVWKLPATSVKTAVADGTWIVGKDVSPGIWQVSGPFASDRCKVVFHSSFTGIADVDVIESLYVDAVGDRYYIFVTDKGFTSDGCGTWKRIGNLP
ncbi:hypothetical protein [Microbacterium pumilum]|uniref:Ig-like domain-containing protein n=1 Tax=Microbacterium pumilum TaxID=344165 RepID=A0ABP5DYC5_9MICO